MDLCSSLLKIEHFQFGQSFFLASYVRFNAARAMMSKKVDTQGVRLSWRADAVVPRLMDSSPFVKGFAMKPLFRSASSARAACLAGMLGVAFGPAAQAQTPGLAAPQLVLKESVLQMPRSDTQEVRVLTASFKPGDQTVFHTHRSPVTVYVLEGQFTLDLEGRAPVVVSAGQAFVEPPHVKMTGHNKSATDALRVVIFYVSEPGTPFLEPAH